jgi:hypothetical protein
LPECENSNQVWISETHVSRGPDLLLSDCLAG